MTLAPVYSLKSQSPYGAMWFATNPDSLTPPAPLESQSPYGAMWFATHGSALANGLSFLRWSQSPYGAMWFATKTATTPSSCWWRKNVAIPLRGYVVCNIFNRVDGLLKAKGVAIPLRGYVVCNEDPRRRGSCASLRRSQSPYGAMWFATQRHRFPRPRDHSGRNPLTGLCGLQRFWRSRGGLTL